MQQALLQTLFNNPSGAQIAGGAMMVVLFVSVGVVAAVALTSVARRVLCGRYEQIYWSVLLIVIAALYSGFAAWFEVPVDAWITELSGIAVFVLVAVAGSFSVKGLALGYAMHGLWDMAHSLFGSVILGHTLSAIPLGYGMFCAGFDLTAAVYLALWPHDWDAPGRFYPKRWKGPVA